ncbi:antibiotic biosynthesis monooxygenase [Amycolatopsis samaneae]|uniref:Antibiotic biosynthesis monooxygenase n=1 Tax=Amycolatopsis samaneae TaxID=664691 RepID=A0ABW5GAF7_9PSEU
MTIGFVGVHYPRPEYFEEFVARVGQVAEILRSRPGCLAARSWVTADGAAVSTVEFESQGALDAAFADSREQLAPLVVFDEREHRPRQVFTLESR